MYIEGLRSAAELKRAGKALKGTPLAMTMMEGGPENDAKTVAELEMLVLHG